MHQTMQMPHQIQVTTFPVYLPHEPVMSMASPLPLFLDFNNNNFWTPSPRYRVPSPQPFRGRENHSPFRYETRASTKSPTPLLDQNNNNLLLQSPHPPSIVLAKGLDANERIGQTQFRIGQCLQWMAQHGDKHWTRLASKRTLMAVKTQQVSGIGFLSYIYRVQFFFDGLKEPFTAILKVPSIINLSVFSKEQEFLSNWAYKLSERHNKEIFCYEHFGRRIADAGIVHVPKLFHATPAESPKDLENGCILMEDLDREGIMANLVLGLSRAQVESILRTLGHIHALSLAVPNSQKLLENLRFKFSLDEEDGQAKFNAIRALIGIGQPYWAQHGEALERLAGKHELMLLESHKQFGVPPVLCHGDMWANNVFFERRPDGTAGQELYAFIDWQFSQPNSGLQDFARLILLCVNATLKLQHLDEWLELYFDTLMEGCRRWGVECPYTMGLVRRMFLAHYPSEMLFSIVILMQTYGRVEDEALKTALLDRITSSYEWLRQKMEINGETI